jgi:hypothetical protein
VLLNYRLEFLRRELVDFPAFGEERLEAARAEFFEKVICKSTDLSPSPDITTHTLDSKIVA